MSTFRLAWLSEPVFSKGSMLDVRRSCMGTKSAQSANETNGVLTTVAHHSSKVSDPTLRQTSKQLPLGEFQWGVTGKYPQLPNEATNTLLPFPNCVQVTPDFQPGQQITGARTRGQAGEVDILLWSQTFKSFGKNIKRRCLFDLNLLVGGNIVIFH